MTKWAKLLHEMKNKISYLNVWHDGVCCGHFDLNAFLFHGDLVTFTLNVLRAREKEILEVEVLLLCLLERGLSVRVNITLLFFKNQKTENRSVVAAEIAL